MKRLRVFLLMSLLIIALLLACELTITDFKVPDTAETGTVVTFTLTGEAQDTGDNATEHGVILQIPENWVVLSAMHNISEPMSPTNRYLNEKPAYESLYIPEDGHKIWVGTSTLTGSGNRTVTVTIKVLIGDFIGGLGTTQGYTVKAAAGAYRDGAWITDDPLGEYDFKNITQDKFVETIVVTKVDDQTAPDPVSTLAVKDLLTGTDVRLDWTGYDDKAQGDVLSYRVYQSTENFFDVTGMAYIEVPAGTFTYEVSGLITQREYYFAVTAVDEVPHENKIVTPISIILHLLDENFETGDLSRYPWSTYGSGNWKVTSTNPYSGFYAAESPCINHNENATLNISMSCKKEGELSFWYSVSSEENYDYLNFYVNNQFQAAWSGSVPYAQETYTVLKPGWYQFRWEYAKDHSVSFGKDAAWLDDIRYRYAGLFDDVPPTHWAYDYIKILSVSGITSGCGGGNYCPGSPVTRAQMAVFLERGINGSDFNPSPASGIFNDVPMTHWAADWIEELFADGITSGCGGGNYCPGSPVTRAQMAVFLLRALYGSGYSPSPAIGIFPDVPTDHWAADWIEELYADGITSGCGGGNYCPGSPVTRAQMAVFLVRTFGL